MGGSVVAIGADRTEWKCKHGLYFSEKFRIAQPFSISGGSFRRSECMASGIFIIGFIRQPVGDFA